jgi:hypothetical protein
MVDIDKLKIMNPFQAILEFFRVKKLIRYHGTMDTLESILGVMESKRREKEEFYIRKMNKYHYGLNPTISIGTPQYYANGMLVHAEKITVKMNLIPKSNNLQEIELLGSLHKFHIFFFLAGLFGFIGSMYALLSYGQFAGLIFTVIVWPVFHLWFNFVWTSQEKALIEEVKLALHIRIRAGIGL